MPSWVAAEKCTANELNVIATPPKQSGAPGTSVKIRIWTAADAVNVAEAQIGHLFPRSCPQRHINHDGTFCLGLNAGANIQNNQLAAEWWGKLAKYLNCQEYAKALAQWPPRQQLSHGNAATFQIEAENFALRLGILQDYLDAVEHHEGWLAGDLPKCSKDERRILNGRAPCPKGCKTKRGAKLLRKQCKDSEIMWGLIANETLRRLEEKHFVQSYRRDDFKCCGTMKNCPFREQGSIL